MTNVGTGRFQIEYRGVESLILDPRNPRQHPQKQVLQIADSIREFGFIMPVVIDDKGQVIIGHGRVLAAKQLRMFEVPVIEVKHLSSTQLKALRIADNKLALNAHWDERLLGEEFVALQELDLDFEIEITGFSAPEIDLTIQNLGREGTQDPDEQGSITGAAVCQYGDLWFLDGHRLLCEDATSEAAFELLMAIDGRISFLPTLHIMCGLTVMSPETAGSKHREFAQAAGEMTSAEFTRFLTNSCGLLADFSADGSIHFVCMDWRHAEELLAAGKQVYSDLKNINVWAKNNAGMGSLYRSQHEFIFVFKSGTARHINNIELGKKRSPSLKHLELCRRQHRGSPRQQSLGATPDRQARHDGHGTRSLIARIAAASSWTHFWGAAPRCSRQNVLVAFAAVWSSIPFTSIRSFAGGRI